LISELEVDYPRAEWAQIICNSLAVDKELHPNQVHKELSIHGNTLKIVFAAVDPRMLRTSVSSFYDFLILASETVDQFGA